MNGGWDGEARQLLCDADRVAIGRAYIFQVQLPKKPKVEGIKESEFERAVGEISACAEVDSLWKNGNHKAMLTVKSDFAIEAANQLLEQTKNASDVIGYGMAFNPMTPSRDRVRRANLSSLARPAEC